MDPRFRSIYEYTLENLDDLKAWAKAPPLHLRDQMDAAVKHEVPKLFGQISGALGDIEGESPGVHEKATNPEKISLLFASLTQLQYCTHIISGNLNSILFVLLPCQSMLCRACAKKGFPPVVRADDQCDLCGERGVTGFHAIAISLGPMFVTGDICEDCFAITSS